MSELWDRSKPARTYEAQPDGRAVLPVILTRGDQAKAVTPRHTGCEPMDLDAAEITHNSNIPPSEVAGREFTTTGDRTSLHDFALVNDRRVRWHVDAGAGTDHECASARIRDPYHPSA
ncbi:hypothetical protein [Nocardia sp. NPDC004711]